MGKHWVPAKLLLFSLPSSKVSTNNFLSDHLKTVLNSQYRFIFEHAEHWHSTGQWVKPSPVKMYFCRFCGFLGIFKQK